MSVDQVFHQEVVSLFSDCADVSEDENGELTCDRVVERS